MEKIKNSKLTYKKDNTIFMAVLIIILECFTMLSTPYSKSVLPVYPLNNLIWSFVFRVFLFVQCVCYILLYRSAYF